MFRPTWPIIRELINKGNVYFSHIFPILAEYLYHNSTPPIPLLTTSLNYKDSLRMSYVYRTRSTLDWDTDHRPEHSVPRDYTLPVPNAITTILLCIYHIWGTAVAQWLRCCATNRKVAGSIPDGVIGIFHWHNPSDRTMVRGSTQPLTEMSTRRISWG